MRRGTNVTTELFAGMQGDLAAGSLQRAVYDRIAAAILSGHLRPGDRLPSTRELARSLGIGRNTATWAVEELAAEGFVEARHGSGTYVSLQLPDRPARAVGHPDCGRAAAVARVARRAERYTAVARSLQVPQRPVPFRINLPAVDDFPVALWRRIMKS